MPNKEWRNRLEDFIRQEARPADKYSHQPRLYALAVRLGTGTSYDDDVLHAAAWLHDLGVFIGHRPEDPAQLAAWDHIAYVTAKAPGLLRDFGFPGSKIPAVLEAIRTHLPSGQPTTQEGVLLRDADILEQLGAVGIVRAVSKVGRDTRFRTHGEAVETMRRNLRELPEQLRLERARELARARITLLESFLASVDLETQGVM